MIVIWDPKKAAANLRKHRVSFEEAQSVLESSLQLILEDTEHDEQRFITLGKSKFSNLLAVIYCYRFEDVVRIISARRATRNERKVYEERV